MPDIEYELMEGFVKIVFRRTERFEVVKYDSEEYQSNPKHPSNGKELARSWQGVTM